MGRVFHVKHCVLVFSPVVPDSEHIGNPCRGRTCHSPRPPVSRNERNVPRGTLLPLEPHPAAGYKSSGITVRRHLGKSRTPRNRQMFHVEHSAQVFHVEHFCGKTGRRGMELLSIQHVYPSVHCTKIRHCKLSRVRSTLQTSLGSPKSRWDALSR